MTTTRESIVIAAAPLVSGSVAAMLSGLAWAGLVLVPAAVVFGFAAGYRRLRQVGTAVHERARRRPRGTGFRGMRQ